MVVSITHVDTNVTVSRMKAYCVGRMAEVTSLSVDDVIGRNLYQFCYVNDLTALRHAHIEGDTLTLLQSMYPV